MPSSEQLPPLGALRTFAVAAQHENFRRAASELGITPTAVSAQVKALEGFVGCLLFERGARHVCLTEAGRQLAGTCETVFSQLSQSVAELRQANQRRSITIGVGPVFGSQWLSKRLISFWDRFPETGLHLQYSPGGVEFAGGSTDMMIAWGDGHWPGLRSEHLLNFAAAPVVSPNLLQSRSQPAVHADLLGFPLLHWKDKTGWQEWFDAMNVGTGPRLSGVVIDDANAVLQAVLNGQGIALGLMPLIQSELASGALVRLFADEFTPSRSYHLVYPPAALRQPSLLEFRDWIIGEASNE